MPIFSFIKKRVQIGKMEQALLHFFTAYVANHEAKPEEHS